MTKRERKGSDILRVYSALPEVRAVLRGVEQDANLGTSSVLSGTGSAGG